jgi:hypothetical protein
MKPRHVMINVRSTRRMLAWSALIAIALVLALLLQALAASALVAPGQVAFSPACQAALAAAENERESFLAHLCDGPVGATATSATLDDPKKAFVTIDAAISPDTIAVLYSPGLHLTGADTELVVKG